MLCRATARQLGKRTEVVIQYHSLSTLSKHAFVIPQDISSSALFQSVSKQLGISGIRQPASSQHAILCPMISSSSKPPSFRMFSTSSSSNQPQQQQQQQQRPLTQLELQEQLKQMEEKQKQAMSKTSVLDATKGKLASHSPVEEEAVMRSPIPKDMIQDRVIDGKEMKVVYSLVSRDAWRNRFFFMSNSICAIFSTYRLGMCIVYPDLDLILPVLMCGLAYFLHYNYSKVIYSRIFKMAVEKDNPDSDLYIWRYNMYGTGYLTIINKNDCLGLKLDDKAEHYSVLNYFPLNVRGAKRTLVLDRSGRFDLSGILNKYIGFDLKTFNKCPPSLTQAEVEILKRREEDELLKVKKMNNSTI